MASVVINGDTSGAVTISAPAVAGTTTLTLPTTSGTVLTTATSTGISGSAISSGTVPEAYGGTGTNTGYYGFKNRIINGAMVIDQRNAGASVTANNVYSVDRWLAISDTSNKWTIQQNAGSVTPPTGFTNYLGCTSSSAYTPTSTDYFGPNQRIEGYNIADLNWGSASASPITLSFWVRSSLTGSFGGSIQNSSQNRSYAFPYTISSANTWEYKTITIIGDTSGTWLTNNGVGFVVHFSLGAGSSRVGTANTWTGTSNVFAPTGSVNVVSTNGATFYITGVQLEKGSTATSFDYRPYGTELQLCQRYFETSYPYGTALGTATTDFCVAGNALQGVVTTTEANIYVKFQTTKRTNPTIAVWDLAGNSNKVTRVEAGVANHNNQTYGGIANPGTTGVVLYSNSGSNCAALKLHFTAASEL
jgi:hypothetical protein